MADWESVNVSSFGERKYVQDLFNCIDIQKDAIKWLPLRHIGDIRIQAGYWFNIQTKTKVISVFKQALNVDSTTGEFIKVKDKKSGETRIKYCPYQELAGKYTIPLTKNVVTNTINRKLQKSKPENLPRPTREEKETGFITKDSQTWTPVQVAILNGTCASKTQNLKGMNERTLKDGTVKEFGPSHATYGFEVNYKCNPQEKGTARFDVSIGTKSKLTDEEKSYFVYDLSLIDTLVQPEAEAKAEAIRLEKQLCTREGKPLYTGKKSSSSSEDDDGLPEDLEDSPKSKKSKKRQVEEDIDLDDSDDDDLDDTPAPKKSTSKKKSRDEDEDDSDIEFDDDLDDEPKKSSKSTVKKSSKKVVEDDDDSDLDLSDIDDMDDDDDAPPAKTSKKSSSKKRQVEEDNDSDDSDNDSLDLSDLDDDSDDSSDDDDAPKKSSKSAKAKKPAPKVTSKPVAKKRR